MKEERPPLFAAVLEDEDETDAVDLLLEVVLKREDEADNETDDEDVMELDCEEEVAWL